MKKLLLIATLVMIPALSHAQTPNLTDQCNQIASDKEKEQGICECIASTIASGGKFSFEDKDEQFSSEELATFETSTFKSILNYEQGENIADKLFMLWANCETPTNAQAPDTADAVESNPAFDKYYSWQTVYEELNGGVFEADGHSITFEEEIKKKKNHIKYDLQILLKVPKIDEDLSWQIFVSIIREYKSKNDVLVYSCNTKDYKTRSILNEDRCQDDNSFFNKPEPFLKKDKVMITLGINRLE